MGILPFTYGGRPRIRGTTLTNHWNGGIQAVISISCYHQSNIHSVSNESLKGFGKIKYETAFH